jgi:hypothetical protein
MTAGNMTLAKKLLYWLLNNKEIQDSFNCISPFRFMPDRNSINLGGKGKDARQKVLTNHASVLQSMEIIRVDSISNLDTPFQPAHGNPITL